MELRRLLQPLRDSVVLTAADTDGENERRDGRSSENADSVSGILYATTSYCGFQVKLLEGREDGAFAGS